MYWQIPRLENGASDLSDKDYTTDPKGLVHIATELMDSWEAHPDSSWEMGQRGQPPAEGRFLSIFGLAAHVHRLGRVVVSLRGEGVLFEAIPLVRLMLESSLTAMWLAQNSDGGGALANEEVRQHRNAVKTMAKSNSPAMRASAAASDLPRLDAERIETSSDQQARAFEALCNDLEPGGPDAYLNYRLMSRYSHAGIHLIEQYMTPNDTGDDVKGISVCPRPLLDEGLWLWYIVSSLIWAGTAMDYIDPDRTRRSQLREAANAVGIERDLHLAPAAQQRIAKADKASRRARWKGKTTK